MLRRSIAAAVAALLPFAALGGAPAKGGQAPGWYRMTLGKFEVTALSDGTVGLPVDRYLKNIRPERMKALLARDYQKLPVETSVNGYLVNTGSKLVLIDAGAAGLFGPAMGKLLGNLKASGYTPEQVDEVYITHLHPDHVGGIAADGKAVFPNAVVRAGREDGDYWLSGKTRAAADADSKGFVQVAMASMKPYVDAGRFKPIAGEGELVPGIRAISAHGHTPGHTIFAIESEGRKMVVWGDLVHLAAVQLVQPTATWASDTDSKAAVRERLRNFADAAKQGYYVALAHVAFPGIGRLRADGKGYLWVPAVYNGAGQ